VYVTNFQSFGSARVFAGTCARRRIASLPFAALSSIALSARGSGPVLSPAHKPIAIRTLVATPHVVVVTGPNGAVACGAIRAR
jgi:hypothetical protein